MRKLKLFTSCSLILFLVSCIVWWDDPASPVIYNAKSEDT